MAEFTFDEASHTLKFKFTGRMDSFVCTQEAPLVEGRLNEALKSLAASGPPQGILKTVFDLKGVDYIASAFIRICLSASKAVKKENFSIVNTDPQVQKVFKIAGLDEQFNVS